MISAHTIGVVVGVHFVELVYAALIYGFVACWRNDEPGWLIGTGVLILLVTAAVWGGFVGA